MNRLLNCRVGRRGFLRAAMMGGAGLLSPAVFGGGAAFAQQRPFAWGSASLGSSGYMRIEAFAATVNKYTKLRNSSMSTAGGGENLALIGQRVIDFGQSSSSDWGPALKGQPPFSAPVDAVQTFCYGFQHMGPIVRADSDIKTIADLEGRRVTPSTSGGSGNIMMNTLLEAAGLKGKVQYTFGSWRESFDALRTGAVDCSLAFLNSGRPSSLLTELEASVKVRPLEVPPDVLKKMNEINPGVFASALTPAAWKSIDKDCSFPALSLVLAANPELDEDVVYQVVKAIYDHEKEVRAFGAHLADIFIDFAPKYLMPRIPVHK
ncbi:MAG: TAXI family TRAP transporter solute-binding subunit, partial [Hyphomicrobiales bacterium]